MADKDNFGGTVRSVKKFTTALMDSVDIIPKHAYGARGQVSNAVEFVRDNELVHLVGGHVILHQVEPPQVQFQQKAENVKDVLGIAVGGGRKRKAKDGTLAQSPPLIALCERPRGEEKAQVTVYFTKVKRKPKTCQYTYKGAFVHAAFSKESKYLAAYGVAATSPSLAEDGEVSQAEAEPSTDGVLVLFNWNKGTVMATAKVQGEITCMRYHPSDVTTITMSGPGIMRAWKVGAETGIREIPFLSSRKETEHTFVGHVWLRDPEPFLVAVTEDGHLYVIQRMHGVTAGEAKKGEDELDGLSKAAESKAAPSGKSGGTTGGGASGAGVGGYDVVLDTIVPFVAGEDMSVGEAEDASAKLKVTSIAASGKGFVVGGNHGFIAVYEKTDDEKNPFMLVKCFQHGVDTFEHLTVSPGDDMLVGYSPESSLQSFPLSNVDSLPGMLPTGEPGVPIAGAPTDEADSVTKAFIGGGLSAAYSKLSKGEGEEGEEGELGEGGDEKKEEDLQNFDFVPRRKTKKHWQSLVASGVHVAPVIDTNVAISQPLFLTIGADSTVRVWDYLNHTSLAHHRFSNEDPICGALHPSGHMAAVGFRDRLRFMNVLLHSMTTFREFQLKQVQAVRFSHGGKYVAVACGLTIVIINVYTCETHATLSQHINAVRDLTWSIDDQLLVSGGDDGAVYVWDVETCTRLQDLYAVSKLKHRSVAITRDKQTLVSAAGLKTSSRGALKFTTSKSGTDYVGRLQVLSGKDTFTVGLKGAEATCVHLDHDDKLLFVGTSAGTVRVYEFPLTSVKMANTVAAVRGPGDSGMPEADLLSEPEYAEFALHSGPITTMSLSPDGRYLFTVAGGKDCSIFVNGVLRSAVKGKRPALAAGVSEEWEPSNSKLFNMGVVLVNKEELTGMREKLIEAEKRLKEVYSESEYKLHVAKQEASRDLREASQRMEAAVNAERRRYDDLSMKHESYIKHQMEEQERAKVEFQKKLQDLENSYEYKLGREIRRFDTLSEDMEALKQEHDDLLATAERAHRSELEVAEQRRKDEVSRLKATIKGLEDRLKEAENGYSVEQEALCKGYEAKIDELKAKMREIVDVKAAQETEAAAQESKENQDQASAMKKLEERNKQYHKKEQELQAAYAKIEALKNQLRENAKSLDSRDDDLLSKQKDLLALRASNRTLENFKMVMDHRLQQLMAERGPISEHVEKLEQHIAKMYEELVAKFNEKKILEADVEEKGRKLQVSESENKRLIGVIHEKSRFINSIQASIEGLAQTNVPDLPAASAIVRSLYHQFVVRDPKAAKKDGVGGSAMEPKGTITVPSNAGGSGAASITVGKSKQEYISVKSHKAIVNELQQQREYLEKTANQAKKRLKQVDKLASEKQKRFMNENTSLIAECNRLREENKRLEQKNRKLETEIFYASQQQSMGGSMTSSRMEESTYSEGLPSELPPGAQTAPTALNDSGFRDDNNDGGDAYAEISRGLNAQLAQSHSAMLPTTKKARTAKLLRSLAQPKGRGPREPGFSSTLGGSGSRSSQAALTAKQKIGELLAQLDESYRTNDMLKRENHALQEQLRATAPKAPLALPSGKDLHTSSLPALRGTSPQ